MVEILHYTMCKYKGDAENDLPVIKVKKRRNNEDEQSTKYISVVLF